MYKMSIRKKLLQKENRIRNRTFEKNLKESIYRLHNETIKNEKKRQHSSDKELEIRDDIS